MNSLKSMQKETLRPITQFDFTKNLINNLQQYDITPTAKLVLIYLSTCYNPKNADVFPKQKTISQNLGISERSVVRSIAELIQKGLIISECGKNNRYRFTNALSIKNFDADKLSDAKCKNDTLQNDKLSDTYIEQTNETNKEQTKKEEYFNNISLADFSKLKRYAASKGAKNVNAYVKVLIKNGSYTEILHRINETEEAEIKAKKRIEETEQLLNSYKRTNFEPIPEEIRRKAEELKKRLKINI